MLFLRAEDRDVLVPIDYQKIVKVLAVSAIFVAILIATGSLLAWLWFV